MIRSRAVVLRENISKWGNPGVVVTQNDPKDFAELPPLFDLVVADAPCSGEGLFRKDRAALTEWSVNNAAHCAARQKRILSDAWNCLKPGGYLIYSTCTFNPAENEENMAWLTGQTGASPVELSPRPEWNIETIRCESMTGYQFLPDRTRGEGFFMAVVRKHGDPADFSHRRLTLRNWKMVSKSVIAALDNWILPGYDFAFLCRQSDYFIFPAGWINTLDVLEKYLRILQPGTQVASGVGNGFNPHPELAHSLVVNQTSFLSRSVDLSEAIGFLRKDNLSAGTSEKGWVLVSYRGIPLGWLKNLETRSNNYFPSERRIRMNITGIPRLWHEQDYGI